MPYFVKITSSWKPSNSLLKYIETKLQLVEQTTVEDPQEVFDFFKGHFALANHTYKRCGKEDVKIREAHNKEDFIIDSSLFNITLYKMNGPFAPAPNDVAKRVPESTESVLTGQTLSMF